MARDPFEVAHLRSSKWDRTRALLLQALLWSIKAGATVILHTEVAAPHRRTALRARGWKVAQDTSTRPRAETAISWSPKVWQDIAWQSRQVGPDLGPGDIIMATVAVLQHIDKGVIALFGVCHMPSSVEGSWWQKTKRVIAYQRAMIQYRRFVREMKREYRPDIQAVAADWNLSVLKEWVRTYLQGVWVGFTLLIAGKMGTHGNRQIDAWMVRYRPRLLRRMKRLGVKRKLRSFPLPHHKSSDHRGVGLVLPLPPVRLRATR